MWGASSADRGSWGGSSPLPTGLARIRSLALRICMQPAGERMPLAQSRATPVELLGLRPKSGCRAVYTHRRLNWELLLVW